MKKEEVKLKVEEKEIAEEAEVLKDSTKEPVLTGKLVFQFDEDTPISILDVYDNKNVVLTLPSNINEDGTKPPAFLYTNNNKVFKLYIKKV